MGKYFLGEVIGTFILVFLGCGIVGLSLIEETINLFIIAAIWGLAVFLGIQASHKMSDSHLNPAVTLGFLTLGSVDIKKASTAILGQFAGATLAALALYLIFNGALSDLEATHGWVRGELSGLNTGKMFGEYYDPSTVSLGEAISSEAFGTFLLMFMILIYSQSMERFPLLSRAFIGLTVTILILFIAPITQCGINPARDLGPRFVSWLTGWDQAFSLPDSGAILTYVLGPALAGPLAVGVFKTWQLLTKN